MNDLLLEMEEKNALLLQYDSERQQFQAQTQEEVYTYICIYI